MTIANEYASYNEGCRAFRHRASEKQNGRSVSVVVWGQATPELLASLDRAYELARADLVVAIDAAEPPASRDWW